MSLILAFRIFKEHFCWLLHVLTLAVLHCTGEQQLRALELNSWQLFRLLQAQLPDLSCSSSCGVNKDGRGYEIGECDGNMEEKFCCLFVKAAALHRSRKFFQVFV